MSNNDSYGFEGNEMLRAVLSNLPEIIGPALKQETVDAALEQVEKIDRALAKLNKAKEDPSAISVEMTMDFSTTVASYGSQAPAAVSMAEVISTPTVQPTPSPNATFVMTTPVPQTLNNGSGDERFGSIEALVEKNRGLFVGSLGGVIFGAAFIIAGSSIPVLSVAAPFTVIGSIAIGIALIPAYASINGLRLAKSFETIKGIVGDRESCTFDELSARSGMSKRRVIANARKLLDFGLFPEGHIDNAETALMLTNESYEKHRQRVSAPAPQNANAAIPMEAYRFIQKGQAHIKRMQALDVAIADEDVSARIASISQIVDRLLNRVQAEPSTVDSLDKLMDYYLPTTIKLLEAYDDLEKEPVQGQNIACLRDEIEGAMQVLDIAYQKLLDESYQDTSLEISSDISALNVVLAQEGLIRTPLDETPERTEDVDR